MAYYLCRMRTIGLIREGKVPFDKRVALTPAQCKEVMERFSEVTILVQPSAHRCIADAEYTTAGIGTLKANGRMG